MLANRIDKDWSDLVPYFRIILEERVGIAIESMFVCSFIRKGIIDKHVHGEQIYNGLLPSDGSMRIY